MLLRQALHVFGVLVMLLATGCGEDHRTSEHGKEEVMLDGLFSMKSINETQKALNGAGYASINMPATPKSGSAAKSGDRPEFEVAELHVRGYLTHGVKGDLKLEFFNDRLMAIWLYAPTADAQKGLENSLRSEHEGSKTVTVLSGIDYMNRQYVRVDYIPLRQEMDDWIAKYA